MGERASTLFRDRIGDVESLYAAWAAIRANADDNTHTGREFRDVERHLADHIEDLAGRILDGSWSPGPLRRATITDDDGDTRVLRIPPLLDRVVERSIVDALTPILDPTFTPWSFAYRRGLGTSDALAALATLRDDGFRWVLRTDFRLFCLIRGSVLTGCSSARRFLLGFPAVQRLVCEAEETACNLGGYGRGRSGSTVVW